MNMPLRNESGAPPQAAGGLARAANLTADERSASAKRAAHARWGTKAEQVVCGSPDKPLRVGSATIECYVLADGTRVLTQADVLEAIGRSRRSGTRSADTLPSFLQGTAIAPYVTDEIRGNARPIVFGRPGGGRAYGFKAELLPEICDIYLQARDDGRLPPNQHKVARQAEIIMRGLARVGIVALVDEATGYQDLRERNALARILEEFVDQELRVWIKTFPDDFYREMSRLRGRGFDESNPRRPMYFGKLTNNIVYERLAPGVLAELKRVTPTDDKGRPRHRLHQKLTQNTGYPKLVSHLGSVVTLMKLSDDWASFERKLDRLHPRYGHTMPLPIDESSDRG